jgi:hypothetical protein
MHRCVYRTFQASGEFGRIIVQMQDGSVGMCLNFDISFHSVDLSTSCRRTFFSTFPVSQEDYKPILRANREIGVRSAT